MSSGGAEYEYYRRIKLLGEGAFGKAYLVECVSDASKCVIKQMDIHSMSEEERRETYKEAQILAALRHPNIIRFREVYRTKQGKLCIVMDYADGKKIQEIKGSRFSENQILDWFTQICLALKHVHDRKILHRDLKSQNIFLTKDNTIKLGDFGIARVLNNTHEKAKTMVGTPYYLSPEIIENMPYSFKSDIWSLGIILYELCCLEPPFNAESLSCLALRIVRGNYNPIGNFYSKELKMLVTSLLQSDPNKRPSVHQILKMPVITNRIKNFLSESIKLYEFSHTIFHKKKFVDLKDLPPEIKPEQPSYQNMAPKGYAHYPLNPNPKNNPNAMDYMPFKKDPIPSNPYHNNAFVSPKNDMFFKENPQPISNNYKNDFADKRKHAISPSPRYRENNIFEKPVDKLINEKLSNKREMKHQMANFKPINLEINKPKENLNLLPPTSNRNKDGGAVLKTPYKEKEKEMKKEEKEKINFQKPLQNSNSYMENMGKNEVCITEPSKIITKKTSEQKFDLLKNKFNIKDKNDEIKKQEAQKDKNREQERKQMMNDIEKKRSVNRKKSDDLVIEWVGPIKPKNNSTGEKTISASEGKEVQGKSQEKKNEFTNFEDLMNDIEENVKINENMIHKSASPIDKNDKQILKEKEKEKASKDKDMLENLRMEINEKIHLCNERETEISQILIELQDIVSGKEIIEDEADFENKMKTIKEEDQEEREDDLNEFKENENDQRQNVALSKKKNNNFMEDNKENISKNSNIYYKNNLQNFLEEIFGKEEFQKVALFLKEQLNYQDLLEISNENTQNNLSKLCPLKKDELEKNFPLILNFCLIEKEI